MQGFLDYVKEFGFHSEFKGKPWEYFIYETNFI